MFSWWTLGACALLAALGELIELAASALGAAKAGGSRAGSCCALGGSIAGAIGGSFFLPPIGTIVGAVLGAGLGAGLGELYFAGKTWNTAAKIGTGAAVGRLVATVCKIGIAVAVAGTLIVTAWAW